MGYFSCDFLYFNFQFGSESAMMWHVHGGSTPPVESGVILDRFGGHDRGDKTRTSTRGDRSKYPRPRPQTIAHRTPPVAPKKNTAAASPIFLPARSATITKTEQTSKKTGNALEAPIAASPMLFRAWRLRAPSAQPRDPESESFLSCATKRKSLAAARTRQRKPSLSSTLVAV